jgi:hypothetical protein
MLASTVDVNTGTDHGIRDYLGSSRWAQSNYRTLSSCGQKGWKVIQFGGLKMEEGGHVTRNLGAEKCKKISYPLEPPERIAALLTSVIAE